jgi:predicted metal-dependent hydrolase
MSELAPPGKRTILQGGRAKAYRPLPEAARRAALADGLAAYDRGDFFLAHEILEPAWMGTSELGERELLQGLIKLSAAFVHAARGNPAGVAKNLRGARDRLESPGGVEAGRELGIDVDVLVERIGERLALLDRASARQGDRNRVASEAGAEPALLAIRIPRGGRT